MTPRIGVASIVQETNTFSRLQTTLADFASQGILRGDELWRLLDVNTEAGGALAALRRRGAEAVPLVKTWAMSGGPITARALSELADLLRTSLQAAGRLDGLVLSLHGALVGSDVDSGDLFLLRAAREVVRPSTPIGICLDLHANVLDELLDESAFVIGYRTYPHVDMAETGARAAELLVDVVEKTARPVTRIAKRQMLTPPEGQGEEGPFGRLRVAADALTRDAVLDIGLFPVQPWLDVPDIGFAVTVTTDDDPDVASRLAEELAQQAWDLRAEFNVELVPPAAALARVRSLQRRPVLLSESADSPTAGAAADSAAMVQALLEHGRGLRAYTTVVDAAGVEQLWAAGEGARIRLELGSTIDRRFHKPVEVEGRIASLGEGPYRLTGPVFTGMDVTMGRHAVLEVGEVGVLVTERPACTFDPETFRRAGCDLGAADVVVVRSANLFRAGWGGLADSAIILDLPGASTPRFASLTYSRIPRPMYPLDD